MKEVKVVIGTNSKLMQKEPIEVITALGFVISKEYKNAYECVLPTGWTFEEINDWGEWTWKYFDPSGNLRITVIRYRDNCIVTDMHHRYRYELGDIDGSDKSEYKVFDKTELIHQGVGGNRFKARDLAQKYLRENFPKWSDPLLYW